MIIKSFDPETKKKEKYEMFIKSTIAMVIKSFNQETRRRRRQNNTKCGAESMIAWAAKQPKNKQSKNKNEVRLSFHFLFDLIYYYYFLRLSSHFIGFIFIFPWDSL